MNIVLQASAPRVEVVDADTDHAFFLQSRLRASDMEEIAAMAADPVLVVLTSSIRDSLRAYTLLVDGTPTVLFGVAVHPDDPKMGVPWLLATDEVRSIRDVFVMFAPPLVDKVCEGFDRLMNFTSATNIVTHRWLESLGFVLGPELPGVGLNGEDLLVFSKEQNNVSTGPCGSAADDNVGGIDCGRGCVGCERGNRNPTGPAADQG